MPYVKRRANAFLLLMAMALVALIVVMILMTIPVRAHAYKPNQQPMFGTYSQAYLDRQQAKRWKQLCNGAGRYQAMGEAYESGKPDPCNKSKN